eukprot:4555897-Pyramimonas_sp.AAC.1
MSLLSNACYRRRAELKRQACLLFAIGVLVVAAIPTILIEGACATGLDGVLLVPRPPPPPPPPPLSVPM